MKIRDSIKLALVAWGVPVALVAVALFASPSPNRQLADFPSTELTSPAIAMSEHSGSRGSDHFELTIAGEGGQSFYHRDPEREPIVSLFDRIPKSVGLRLTYEPSLEGNVLLDVRPIDGIGKPFLDFATTMREYAQRRRVIYWVAGIWFVIGSLLFYALSSVKIEPPRSELA